MVIGLQHTLHNNCCVDSVVHAIIRASKESLFFYIISSIAIPSSMKGPLISCSNCKTTPFIIFMAALFLPLLHHLFLLILSSSPLLLSCSCSCSLLFVVFLLSFLLPSCLSCVGSLSALRSISFLDGWIVYAEGKQTKGYSLARMAMVSHGLLFCVCLLFYVIALHTTYPGTLAMAHL